MRTILSKKHHDGERCHLVMYTLHSRAYNTTWRFVNILSLFLIFGVATGGQPPLANYTLMSFAVVLRTFALTLNIVSNT